MIKYKDFRYRYCVRTLPLLKTKRPIEATEIKLPVLPLIHYLSDSIFEYGIRPTHPLIQRSEFPVRIYHVPDMEPVKANPRRLTVNINGFINAYFKETGDQFTRARNLNRILLDKRSTVVMDYSLLPHLFKYVENRSYFFDQRENLFHRQLEMMEEVGDRRYQFWEFRLPELIPTLARFRRMEKPLSPMFYEEWRDEETYDLLQFWWLIHQELPFHEEVTGRITVVFHAKQYLTMVNLLDLVTWLQDDRKTTELNLYYSWMNTMSAAYGIDLTDLERAEKEEEVAEANQYEEPGVIEQKLQTVRSGFTPTEKIPERSLPDETAVDDQPPVKAAIEEGKPEYLSDEAVETYISTQIEMGNMSAAEKNRFLRLAESYKRIPNPFGEGNLEDFLPIPEEARKVDPYEPVVPENPNLIEQSMRNSAVDMFTKKYIAQVLKRDILNTTLSFQNAGVLVRDVKVTSVKDALNDYSEYKLKLLPVNGKESTFTFRLPNVTPDGEWMANGVKYRLVNQRGDLPIRKINGARAALTSYYGKVFINRDPKAVNNFSRWIAKKLTVASMGEDAFIENLVFSTIEPPKEMVPRTYSAITQVALRFDAKGYRFYFDYGNHEKHFTPEALEACKKKDLTPVAVDLKNNTRILGMQMDGVLQEWDGKEWTRLTKLPRFLDESWGDGPVEYATMRVFGKNVPVIVVLGYLVGLEKALRLAEVTHRWVPRKERASLTDDEVAFRFRNDYLAVQKNDLRGLLLVGGLNLFHRNLSSVDSAELNQRSSYGHLLEGVGIGRHILREIELMDQMFIDPITFEVLKEMKEPTRFRPLLVRAVELLVTDAHPDEMDPAMMRIKGYERFAGFVYNRMISALREQRNAPNPAKTPVSVSETAVWGDLLADSAKILIEESNPIHNLKERESVTFAGQGGRSADTMTAKTRVFHENDVGTVSESTPDSNKVGIRVHLSPNPKFTSVRGISTRFDPEKDTAVSALSTPSNFNPGSVNMDAKRVNYKAPSISNGRVNDI